MTSTIAGFNLPSLEPKHKLHRILNSALGQKPTEKREHVASLWNAEFFGLTKSTFFSEATSLEQAQITQIASQGLLSESYFIEKAGVGYMSKMTLLAETTEERMLYSLFSADETAHLAALSKFIAIEATADPFLKLLESLLETASRPVLIFVIQVVLEGWGLNHYRLLSKSCQHAGLAHLFHSFLQAESRHHGAGVTLFDETTLFNADCTTIVESLADFLQMIQVGPQRVIEAVSIVKGGLSHGQRVRLLSELETETHSGSRLNLLRSLITPNAPKIADALDAKGLFLPLPPAQCA